VGLRTFVRGSADKLAHVTSHLYRTRLESSDSAGFKMAIKLQGPWRAGWALDVHVLSSVPRGDGTYDTVRSELGQKLFELKYRNAREYVEPLADAAARFIGALLVRPYLDALVPVPPSTSRALQPVTEVARAIGRKTGLPVAEDYLRKTKPTQALKDIFDSTERKAQLAGAFAVSDDRFAGKRVLVFDDLFRSGETLSEITHTLADEGKVDRVYVLTLTRTRSLR
jgi:competence protein ComFC